MNNHENKLNRRDWFRLQLPHQNQALGTEQQEAEMADHLQPVEHPVNHDGMNLDDLPPMREALLSLDQVDTLFTDIEKLATDVQLMQRSRRSTTAQSNDSATNLSAAKIAFQLNQVKRLQIRYRWEDTLWIDTLEMQDSGVRLIRIMHNGM